MQRQGHRVDVLRTVRPAVLGLGKALALGYATLASAAPVSMLQLRDLHNDEAEAEGAALWVLFSISMVLVLLGGAFAGLTIALMGQDSVYLQVLSQDPEEPQRKNAKRVADLLGRGKHWVLVTLLLSNVIVNETLPVVLDRCFGGGVAAVVGSTVLIVIFGEVLPQSVCVRYGLQIGGFMSKPVLLLMYLMFPVAWPTAKLLDKLLGEDHGTVYKKSGLKTLVTLHKSMGEVSERLNQDEVTIISAVLDLKRKPVEDVMTPMGDVLILSEDTVLDEEITSLISEAGFSRIPIHRTGNEQDFVGMLLVKMLITYDPEDAKRVKDFALAALPETRPETSCLDILNFFQEGKSHMVLISEYPGESYGALGVITLEDVIEELIGEEIIDESDVYVDVHKAIRRSHPAPKARVQRKDLMLKDAAVKDGKLIDVDDETDQALHKIPSTGGGATMLSSSPRTTLLMRRSSTGQDGQLVHTTVPVKANYEEMRDHLKHLGPSNPASNPKSTNISSVKIKPGSAIRSNLTAVEHEEHENDEHHDHDHDDTDTDGANERTSLLGKKTDDQPHRNYTTPPPEPAKEDRPLLTITETVEDIAAKQTSPQVKAVNDQSVTSSPVSAGSSRDGLQPDRPRTKRGVRSGSINEIEVSTGGVRKFVLEATSSGDEAGEGSNKSSPTTLRQMSDDDGKDHDEAQGESNAAAASSDEPSQEAGGSNTASGSGQGGSNNNSQRKKKNKKKKKNGTRF